MQASAPSSVVRRAIRSRPPTISEAPAKIV